MLQVQETGYSHVTSDAMLNKRLSGYSRDYETTTENNKVEEMNVEDEDGVGASSLNSSIVGKNTKPDKMKLGTSENATPQTVPPRQINEAATFSNRSSTSSMESSNSSTTSSEKPGEEKSVSKYAQLDIAKILHTRKRIHRILQVSVDELIEMEPQIEDAQTTVGKKKQSRRPKRYTHYNTVGSSRGRAMTNQMRRLSNSSPTSTGDEYSDNSMQSGDNSTFERLRKGKDENGNLPESAKWFASDSNGLRSSGSEEDVKRNSGGYERKRWSRLSSSSQSSDKANQSGQKGPWKAFRKLVHSNNSPTKQPPREDLRIPINATNNNSKVHGEEARGAGDARIRSASFISSNKASHHRHPSSTKAPSAPRYHTNSLLRKFSKKSSTRDRDSRRKSLPTQSQWDVRTDGVRDVSSSASAPHNPPLSRFQYGDGSQSRVDIESMVMSSLQNRIEEESQEIEEKSKKSSSFRKRIMSITKRKNTSKERKSILKSKTQPPSNEGGQMSKALSYSSPQLSVFSVNTPSPRTGTQQKLVF